MEIIWYSFLSAELKILVDNGLKRREVEKENVLKDNVNLYNTEG